MGLDSSLVPNWSAATKAVSANYTNIRGNAGNQPVYTGTTNALSAINNHIGCTGTPITYVVLENKNFPTVTFELERTLFRGEIMSSGIALEYSSFSSITAGFLLDTGYYTINTDKLDPYPFGKNAGCSFMNQSSAGGSFYCSEDTTDDNRACSLE